MAKYEEYDYNYCKIFLFKKKKLEAEATDIMEVYLVIIDKLDKKKKKLAVCLKL